MKEFMKKFFEASKKACSFLGLYALNEVESVALAMACFGKIHPLWVPMLAVVLLAFVVRFVKINHSVIPVVQWKNWFARLIFGLVLGSLIVVILAS